MSDIKIFVSCHKKSYIPKNDILIPIQVGSAMASERFVGYLHDDEGENISEKNKSYCELTAQYWAWKNCDADYYGFFHYRRYMSFVDERLGDIDSYVKFPYCTEDIQELIGLNVERIQDVVNQYDVVTLIPKILDEYDTIRSDYAKHPVHFIEDLDEVCLDILKEKYPEIYDTAVRYLNCNVSYYCNMFIAKKNIFDKYSEFLFDILEAFENKRDFTFYNSAQYRIMGYLGERLWGIYYCYLKEQGNVKTKELQRVEFAYTDIMFLPAPQKHNVVNIVISSSDYYTPYAAVLLKSIAMNTSPECSYNIIVFHLGLKDINKQILSENLAEYMNISINFVDITPLASQYHLRGKGYVSIHSWLRLFTPYVLREYEKVIYLDSDMVVNRDVAELFSVDVREYFLAAPRDYRVIGSGVVFPRRKKYVKEELEIINPYDYFQAGVIVLNLNRFRQEYSLDDLMEICQSKQWELLDQDMLNSILQGQYKLIDSRWDVVVDWNNRCKSWIESIPHDLYDMYYEAYKEPYIVHYGGPYKPWSNPDIDYCSLFWHYAKNSTQSEYILLRAMIEKDRSVEARNSRAVSGNQRKTPVYKNKGRFLNKLFPKDSRRRNFIKKVFRHNKNLYNKLHERYGV